MQRVLIVDDSQLVHDVMQATLVKINVEVFHAHDGYEGIAQAHKIKPDLIILDVQMPKQSGFEVCKIIKDDPDLTNIPIIFATGEKKPDQIVHGLNLGAMDYIGKPFCPDELLARARSALSVKKMMDLLTQEANIDGLTGLHNRRYFDTRLTQEMKRATRHHLNISLALIDVDHFKSVNDTFGHPKGDMALRLVSDAITYTVRDIDIACRYGGDEFAIILPDTNHEGAKQLGTRLLKSIHSSKDIARLFETPITITIGTATKATDQDIDAGGLILKTDQSLYYAKENGRDQLASLDDNDQLQSVIDTPETPDSRNTPTQQAA